MLLKIKKDLVESDGDESECVGESESASSPQSKCRSSLVTRSRDTFPAPAWGNGTLWCPSGVGDAGRAARPFPGTSAGGCAGWDCSVMGRQPVPPRAPRGPRGGDAEIRGLGL